MDNSFAPLYVPEVDFYSDLIKSTPCMLAYSALAPLYYRGAAVAVIVYDITSPESFKKAQYLELQKQGAQDIVMDFERRCRGIPLENAPPDMCHKPNRDAECLRLCKESGPKTGFYFGTCAVKDNKHYCHCYNNICGPPLPPIKGPPPRV
ncbi:unnamed protein product [Brassica rapa subsp. trilocularis]